MPSSLTHSRFHSDDEYSALGPDFWVPKDVPNRSVQATEDLECE